MDFVVIATSFVAGGVIGSLFVRWWINKEIEMVHNENVELREVLPENNKMALDLVDADEKIARQAEKIHCQSTEIARLKREQMHIPRPSVPHWTERNYQAGA